MKNRIIVILGPTSSGKSALGIKLAKKFGGEIISADSRQIYKRLNLASGKVTKKEMKGVKHYCLDIVTLKTHFSVVQFRKCARRALLEIEKRKKTPLLVGGTAFYIKTVTDNLFIPEIPADWELRKKLEKETVKQLFKRLRKMDPRRASTIEKKNKRRLIRAIEIINTTGKPVPLTTSDFVNYGNRTSLLLLGIKIDDKILKQKIEKRLDERLKKGMIREIKRLYESGVSWKRLGELGLEPRWIARFLQKKITKTEMKKRILRDIFRFVKHQYTWWRKDTRIHWIHSQKEAEKYIQKFLRK